MPPVAPNVPHGRKADTYEKANNAVNKRKEWDEKRDRKPRHVSSVRAVLRFHNSLSPARRGCRLSLERMLKANRALHAHVRLPGPRVFLPPSEAWPRRSCLQRTRTTGSGRAPTNFRARLADTADSGSLFGGLVTRVTSFTFAAHLASPRHQQRPMGSEVAGNEQS